VRNLLRQILSQLPSLPSAIDEMHQADVRGGIPPQYPALVNQLMATVLEFECVFVFLDGLDECSDGQQGEVVSLIGRFTKAKARVLLACQPQLMDLVSKHGSFMPQKITAQKKDLETYISQELAEDPHLEQIMLEKLTVDADGM